MNDKTKFRVFLTNNVCFFQAFIIAAILLLVSGSYLIAVCSFASFLLYSFRKKTWCKFLYIIPLPFFFLSSSKFLAGVALFLFFIFLKKNEKSENKKEWLVGMIFPLLLYFTIEFLQNNVRGLFICLLKLKDIQHYGHLYGILVIIAVITFLHLFFSKKVSYYITTALFGLFGIVNFFVVAFTSQGFIPTDFLIAQTGFACLTSQSLAFKDIMRLAIGIVMLVALVLAVTFAFKNEQRDTRKVGQKLSSLTAVLIFALISTATCPWFKNNLLLFNSNQKYGFITNFIINFSSGIDWPDGLEEYQVEDKDVGGDFAPNVIIVMNEAFSDLNGVFGLEGKDNLSYFNSLREQYPSGIAYSSVKGNNTCSSEWECLSGVSTALTTKGANIYQENCRFMNSLVNVFNRRGYYTVGVHPYGRAGYNRQNVYEAIGFQNTVFAENFGPATTVRQFISDESNYKKIIELYEENGDKPFFCFNVTMQNHGGYQQESDDVVPYDTTPYDDVNHYLSLVNMADDALKTLIHYFENVKEPTIILFFGDHQPAITNSFYETYLNTEYNDLTVEQLKKIYQVPYLIWANYELNDEAAPEEVSINYLSSVLFEVGNIPSTTWLDELKSFRSEWPIVTVNFTEDKDGNLFTIDKVRENELLKEYSMMSYAILKGNGDD